MAKKGKKKKEEMKKFSKKYGETYSQNVEDINIGEHCKENMMIFGTNNNVLRHTPDVIDGLKIGARRLLYTMYALMGLKYTGKRAKVDTITSMTIKIHPHGSSSVYSTLVKMGQPWNNLCCTIDKKGNYGSIMGGVPAAERYIEAKLSQFAYDCFFKDFDENICPMKPSYSEDLMEPEFLPARYPYVLINNTFGIGYGVSCGIPTFTFEDVCKLTISLMKNPNLKDVFLIPDSPSGAHIVDEGHFQELCETGKGSLTSRGEVELGDTYLIIKSTPIRKTLKDIKSKIIALKKSGPLSALTDIEDLSREQIHCKLIFKPGTDIKAMEHILYKRTGLQATESVRFSVVEDYKFKEPSLKDILLTWIDYRRDYKANMYNKMYVTLNERLHMLDILVEILQNDRIERTVQIVKGSGDDDDSVQKLMEEFDFITSVQAKHICGMKINNFNRKSRERFIEERQKVIKEIERITEIMFSDDMIDEIIIAELKDGISKYSEERRSQIINIDGEETMTDSKHTLVFTNSRHVKKLPDDITEVGFIAQGDHPTDIVKVSNAKDIMIFDTFGKLYKMPVSKIPAHSLKERGSIITSFINLQGDIRAIIPAPTAKAVEEAEATSNELFYTISITKNGIVKKTPLSQYIAARNEISALVLKEGDELVSVINIHGNRDILLYTSKGNAVRLNTLEVRETSRMTVGIKGINLEDGDTVVGASLVKHSADYVLFITDRGNVKRCRLSDFAPMDRLAKPIKMIGLTGDELLTAGYTVSEDDVYRVYLKEQVIDLEMSTDVPVLPKLSKGKKVIPVKRGDVIIDIRRIK